MCCPDSADRATISGLLVHSLTKVSLPLSFTSMTLQPESIARDLRPLLHGDVEFDRVSRQLYATDAGLSQIVPLGVVSPRDTEDVARLASYAVARGLSLVPRGMGSGLNGAAVGAGIQVDFTRYMNQVIEVAPDASWVRVQPGVGMAWLNRFLQPYGVFFAPDPSSENHCCLGGMIGTNASGARSVAYGATKDHVLALQLVMADGSTFEARPYVLGSPELAQFLAGDSLAGRAFAAVLPELQAGQEMIRAHMPHVVKNSCGYRVESILGDDPATGAPVAHLQRLFVGAEGTLGLVTEATLNLMPLPAKRGIAMAYFPSIFASGEAVPGILALHPTAVEIMDSRFLAVVRADDSRVDAMLPKDTDTALLIEFEGADETEIDEKFATLRTHLDGTAAISLVRAAGAADTEHLWRVRKSAVALMQRMPGPRQPLPFIEDICVHPTEMPACVDFLQNLFDREGVEAVMVGHMGDGNIHTRPVLDPKDPGDRVTMQRIYDEVTAYVLGVRGTMAGEHGDGLVHTPRLQEMYGEEIYALFTRIKNAFDPGNVLNPGKKVGPQEPRHTLFEAVRYPEGYHTLPQETMLHFVKRGYESEIERCHGCAVCKSTVATTMCPVYKATRKEHASPRAKANLLRGIITGGMAVDDAYGWEITKATTDYCIECGMCAVECPSRVNIPKLMLEAKSKYRAFHHAAPVEMMLGRAETVSRLGSLAAPLANRVTNNHLLRRLAEPVVGVDRRRPMAAFSGRTFKRQAGADDHQLAPTRDLAAGGAAAGGRRRPLVAYFSDLFANYNDPELGLAVVRILEAHGYEVVVPEQRSSGIPEMLYGYAAKAAETACFNIAGALPFVKRGATLVSAEPTATFAFKVHYSDYVNATETSLVANATCDLGEFLVRRRADHPESAPKAGPPVASGLHHDRETLRIAYHQPCHSKAQQIGNPAIELLREIPGVEVVDLAAGCCGMAGTFGMKAGTYDLSMLTGKPLFDRIAGVAPDILVSDCSTCRMQLAHATGLPTVHPVTLLAEAYGV
jgi:FAD/FMN-containing dehydrogenase/Fe-S oxidoreductase